MRSAARVRAGAARPIAVLAELHADVQLATEEARAPVGARWTYELELDGYRVVALKSLDDVRLLRPRRGECTDAFPTIARAVAALGPRECVLDGELCALDGRGVPSFRLLEDRDGANGKIRLAYFVFDLLALNGGDLRARPLAERRARLAELLDDGVRARGMVLSASVAGDPSTVLRLACTSGMRGIVAKDATAPYVAGRSRSWRKVECGDRQAKPVRRAARVDVAGVSISHPDRRLDPAGVTKLELARYYEAVGRVMLPHVRGRPLTLLRWAEGKETEKGGVYVRHARAWGPKELRRVRIREQKKTGEYLVVESEAGLVALAQMDILEIHTWSSIADDVERPDRLVFDLDPAPDVGWDEVASAAVDVRERLRALRLESWVKLTGGKGLHVVVPIEPDAEWDRCFAFTRDFARSLVASAPGKYVATMAKSARHGRIFVDYLRNNRTSTSVAAYSTRARPGAPVSLPIRWRDLGSVATPAPTMAQVLEGLRLRRADPWAGYWETRQKLPA